MATVVVSVDAALGWRCIDRRSPPIERVQAARAGWRTMLDRFDEYDLSATWGVVGHLLLEDCDGVHEHHPLAPAWFEREREAWADRRELRFARNLVAETAEAPADHELAFMPFSHVEFGHDEVTTDLARAECVGFFDALPDDLPSPRTAAFPRNVVGHRDVLAEWGFECYRGRIPGRATDLPVARAARRLANATITGPPIVRPTVDEYGLVALPTSLDCSGAESAAGRLYDRAIDDPTCAAVRRGLERVADSEDGVFHCRLRPIDVVDDRDESRLDAICRAIAEYRDESGVAVETVGAVADRARSAPPSRWSHPTT
jgi:hypothetical protein